MDYSVRQISETLGFTRSNFYYQPKKDPCEDVLRDEIEKLTAAYPTYGYRRITKLLVNQGYTVGYRRVARLMKAENLCGFPSNVRVKPPTLLTVCVLGGIA